VKRAAGDESETLILTYWGIMPGNGWCEEPKHEAALNTGPVY
jgi:hypothetical protein